MLRMTRVAQNQLRGRGLRGFPELLDRHSQAVGNQDKPELWRRQEEIEVRQVITGQKADSGTEPDTDRCQMIGEPVCSFIDIPIAVPTALEPDRLTIRRQFCSQGSDIEFHRAMVRIQQGLEDIRCPASGAAHPGNKPHCQPNFVTQFTGDNLAGLCRTESSTPSNGGGETFRILA